MMDFGHNFQVFWVFFWGFWGKKIKDAQFSDRSFCLHEFSLCDSWFLIYGRFCILQWLTVRWDCEPDSDANQFRLGSSILKKNIQISVKSWMHYKWKNKKSIISQKLRIAQKTLMNWKIIVRSFPIFSVNLATVEQFFL